MHPVWQRSLFGTRTGKCVYSCVSAVYLSKNQNTWKVQRTKALKTFYSWNIEFHHSGQLSCWTATEVVCCRCTWICQVLLAVTQTNPFLCGECFLGYFCHCCIAFSSNLTQNQKRNGSDVIIFDIYCDTSQDFSGNTIYKTDRTQKKTDTQEEHWTSYKIFKIN